MRILHWRRLPLSTFNLTILIFCSLFLTILFCIKQSHLLPLFSSSYQNCYDFIQQDSMLQSSSIPPHYLLIPYHEFAMRTSISCRTYRLDSPRKHLLNIHPKYSPYLRGTFPYVIPASNITFTDIERFYTKILIHKKNNTKVIDTSFARNITFENVPYRFRNGMWQPIGYTSVQRTAILIPLQGREYNAKVFLLNIHAFARRQLLTYRILLVEQVAPLGNRFNKGRLFNAGIRYIEKEGLNITCLILHDVDLIPEHDGNFYTCETLHPKHTTIRVRPVLTRSGYMRYYEFLIGGVLILSLDMYKNVNGFSNLYWGWGGEDDDLSLRLIERRMCVVRPAYNLAIYAALPHPRGQRNNARFGLLTWSTIRIDSDGYEQIDPMIRVVNIRKSSTVTHLKLDVNADNGLYHPPPIEKFQNLINKTDEKFTTMSQTIKMTSRTLPKTTTTLSTTVTKNR